MKTPSKISTQARTLFVVMGSFKNKIPVTILVIGSNKPTMLVTVGPEYLMLIGMKVLAKHDTKNASNIVYNHPLGVMTKTKFLLIIPATNKYTEENIDK
jgi:hypothetical protein